MGDVAYFSGLYSGKEGAPILSNPYPQDSTEFRRWVDGWVDGFKERREIEDV